MADETPWTDSIPNVGKTYLGLSRNASYRAADRGEIPTIRVGKLRKALPKRMEQMLAGADAK